MAFETIIVAVYFSTLGLLSAFVLHRAWLLARFRPWPLGGEPPTRAHGELPVVTVQLPIFNELGVAARIVKAAGVLDYPLELLEIQVLDDSTDVTSEIVEREVALLRERGVDAVVLHRTERSGFKAGALEEGLRAARGELICVFDADFFPPPEFLRDVVGAFADPDVGFVQARWGHDNRDASWLTRAQATLLDGLFVIEHRTRHLLGLFPNFNGTAGVWRRTAIEAAGGWRHDTLTEDLDLSLRAQLGGWRAVYAPTVVAPAELPPDMAALKSQQHRWAKGGVQVLRKLAPLLLRPARTAHPIARLDATMHLAANLVHPFVLLFALLMPLACRVPTDVPSAVHGVIFLLCAASAFVYYERGQRVLGRSLGQRLADTAAAIALGLGLSLSQTRAALEGLRGPVGEFVRTPKRSAYRARAPRLRGAELVVALWLLFGIVEAARLGQWGGLPFLGLFCAGFTWVGVGSLQRPRKETTCLGSTTPARTTPSRSTATAP